MKLLKELLLYAFSGQVSRTLEMLNTGTFVSHAIMVKIFLHATRVDDDSGGFDDEYTD